MAAERKVVDVLADITVEVIRPSDRKGYWWVVATQGERTLERMSFGSREDATAERYAMAHRWQKEQRAAVGELIEAAHRVTFAPINTCDGNPHYAEVGRDELNALSAAIVRCGGRA